MCLLETHRHISRWKLNINEYRQDAFPYMQTNCLLCSCFFFSYRLLLGWMYVDSKAMTRALCWVTFSNLISILQKRRPFNVNLIRLFSLNYNFSFIFLFHFVIDWLFWISCSSQYIVTNLLLAISLCKMVASYFRMH